MNMLSLFLLTVYSPLQMVVLACLIFLFINLIARKICDDTIQYHKRREERTAKEIEKIRNHIAILNRSLDNSLGMDEIKAMLDSGHFHHHKIPKRRNQSHPLTNIFKDNV